MSSPWQADRGLGQGRITPLGWIAPEGSYVFVLGHDIPGVKRWFAIGDYLEISQSMTPPVGSKYVRATFRIRAPAEMPLGTQWRLELRVDGVVRVTHDLLPNRTRDRMDLGVNIAGLSVADHVFAFRLSLVGGGVEPFYDLEMPGVYVDAVLFDLSTTRPSLINRDPEPNETGVRVDTNIRVDITDVGAAGAIALAGTRVYLAGVLAFDSGTFQVGFTGPGSAYSTPTSTLRIVIDPIQPLEGLSTYAVRVVSSSSVDAAPIDSTYTFETEDLAAPGLVTVMPTSQTTLELIWSQAVLQEDAAGAADSLNPANYTFELVPPEDGFQVAVIVYPTSVRALSSSAVEITTDIEMTAGAAYRIIATNVEDLFGNSVGTPTDRLDFTGYVCPAPDGRDFQLINMLPAENLSEDETLDLQKFVAIYQEITDLILCDIDDFNDILDPDTAPEKFVDLMLQDMGNPFSFDLTENDKRKLVQLLVPIYKQKGTDPGIINAIRLFMGIETTITVPAFSGAGLGEAILGTTWVMGSSEASDLYTFIVNVPQELSDAQEATMIGIVDYMKAAHTHFKIVEPPAAPVLPDHLELGLSQLGLNFQLH